MGSIVENRSRAINEKVTLWPCPPAHTAWESPRCSSGRAAVWDYESEWSTTSPTSPRTISYISAQRAEETLSVERSRPVALLGGNGWKSSIHTTPRLLNKEVRRDGPEFLKLVHPLAPLSLMREATLERAEP